MRPRRPASVLIALAGLSWPAGPAAGHGDDDHAAARAALSAAQAAIVDAAAAVAAGDFDAALARIEDARDALPGAGDGGRAGPAIRRARRRLAFARRAAEPLTPADGAARAVAWLGASAAAVRDATVALGRRGLAGCALVETGGPSASIHRPGYAARFRIAGSRGEARDAVLTVASDDPQREPVSPDVVPLGRGRFLVRWGPDLGAASITAECAEDAPVRLFCAGPSGALDAPIPALPDYGDAPHRGRVGAAFEVPAPALAGRGGLAFSVAPALPAGLSLDPVTGAVGGKPGEPGPAATFRVTVTSPRASAEADLVLDIDPALPEGVEHLEGGFGIEALAEIPAIPVKLAALADGRALVSELTTGNVRVIGADGTLAPDPLLTVPILAGPELGLFGLAPAPDFLASGRLFVLASAPAEGALPDRNRILGYTVAGGQVTGPDVVADGLPAGITQNGGHLVFGPDGNLYATTGDTGDADLAQADGSLAGRVLRIAPDGSVPAGNPVPGSWEWARGFRNAFGLTFDRANGFLFATENGPAAHDELLYVQPGRNFEWGAPPDAHFGALAGVLLIDWTPVIVPTGIAWHDGAQFGADYAGSLFVGCYDEAQVRRLAMEGIDVREETVFARFSEHGIAQKPLDVVVAADGSLLVSTFATVWRVFRD